MNKNPEITLIPGCAVWNRTPEAKPMSVRSRGIENGIIDIRFGIFGTDNVAGIPMRSLPFTIEHAPEGTRTFALTLLDYDSVPVAGFCWIHWLAANFDRTEMPENASAEDSSDFVQGVNSWGAPLLGPNALHREAASAYGGHGSAERTAPLSADRLRAQRKAAAQGWFPDERTARRDERPCARSRHTERPLSGAGGVRVCPRISPGPPLPDRFTAVPGGRLHTRRGTAPRCAGYQNAARHGRGPPHRVSAETPERRQSRPPAPRHRTEAPENRSGPVSRYRRCRRYRTPPAASRRRLLRSACSAGLSYFDASTNKSAAR